MPAVPVDPYVIDVLMADLVGHDRSPSSFLVYLYLYRRSHGRGAASVTVSLSTLAVDVGLSRRAVQLALRNLVRRRLLRANKAHATAVPVYSVLQTWRRTTAASN